MNKGTTKSIEIQQDSMMIELTFEEISVVSGGGPFAKWVECINRPGPGPWGAPWGPTVDVRPRVGN